MGQAAVRRRARSLEDLKNKQREEIRAGAGRAQPPEQRAGQPGRRRGAGSASTQLFADPASAEATLGEVTGNNGKLDDLTAWLAQDLRVRSLASDELAKLDREEARRRVSQVVEDHFRPEMRRMERALLLQILDTAWKEHLLAMDHLRSSVGLRGYAQIDPKVEYKREGMRLFETMWVGVGNYVTDLIFKMEQLDEGFVGSTWVETAGDQGRGRPGQRNRPASKRPRSTAPRPSKKIEPIRNREEKVGRNEPCPCGSGKKYKNCCMRKLIGRVA